jgi:nucleotide-binding universal stress UspA family protein
MKKALKKVLVGIDGSGRAHQAVGYLSDIPSLKERIIVLLNVSSEMPESCWDIGKQELFRSTIAEVHSWNMEREEEMQKCLERAQQVLLNAGFRDDRVATKIQRRKEGFARDIIGEAKKGYDAIVVGRRGVGMLPEIGLGSMAIKLLEKVNFTPLLLVGKTSSVDNVLIAFDGSDNAVRAVHYAASVLRGCSCHIGLVQVIRGVSKEYDDTIKKMAQEGLDEAKGRLIKSGFSPTRINTKIISGEKSRAVGIIKEAKRAGYGTIVVGRRGLSEVRRFSMGRVSNKVVHLARGLAVWIVN